MPFAIFTHSDTEPARVLYSHLTEETAIEVVDRINTKLYERGTRLALITKNIQQTPNS